MSGDNPTPYQNHIRRMSEESEDFIMHRKTGVACEYVHHPEGQETDAVLIVKVDTSGCCVSVEENKELRICWPCAIGPRSGWMDQWQCACQEENSEHESNELTFVGEIQPSEEAMKAANA